LKKIIISLALAAMAFAHVSKAADKLITALPFTITAPGTYKLSPANRGMVSTQFGVTINNTTAGAVILDLNGCIVDGSLSSPSANTYPRIVISYSSSTSPVTIKNGDVENFLSGLICYPALPQGYSNITLTNMTFTCWVDDVICTNVSNSTISNCYFSGNNDGNPNFEAEV
jgi:hypothetical protein